MRQLNTKPSKWSMAFKSIGALLPVGALVLGVAFSFNAAAVESSSSTVVVTPSNIQGWSMADTRPGGAVNFVEDATSPLPSGALQLTTDATTTSKAQYLHAANTPLSEVTELSYSTKNVSGPAIADASYQLVANLKGTSGFTTLVYEPYQNGTVTPGIWENQDVSSGRFWSTRSVTCSNGAIVGTPGGPASYTLTQIKSICPEAVVIGFGVNIGTFNANYNVEVDAVNFNGTTYDFEVSQSATAAKEACKNGGYQILMDANGNSFKNQGQCVSDATSSSQSKMHRS